MLSDSLISTVPLSGSNRISTPMQNQVSDLFEEHREGIYRYILTLGLSPAQAQEATQEVFLRLYVTLRRKVEIKNPKAWIYRVAHNYGLKVRQREHSMQEFDPQLEARLVDPESNPEMSAIERERTVKFHRAVENLSERQQHCLRLRMEGLRYPEIAEALGISASAVGEFMRRAIARLRSLRHE
jgi:RNA polymerase sigma-70 factor, ECF subfamily